MHQPQTRPVCILVMGLIFSGQIWCIMHYWPLQVFLKLSRQHLVRKCSALQALRKRDDGLFSDEATMVQIMMMWLHDIRAVVQPINECMDAHVHCECLTLRARRQISPGEVAGFDVKFLCLGEEEETHEMYPSAAHT